MKRFAALSVLLCLVLSCAPGLPRRAATILGEKGTSVTIENDFLRLAFDKTAKGNLTEFFDKTSGRNLLAPSPAGAYLYRMETVNDKDEKKSFDNTQAQDSRITLSGDTVTLVNQTHAGEPITVTATCRVRSDSPLTAWRIEVRSNSKLKIRGVTFPCFITQPGADYVLFPYCDGYLIEKPSESLPKGYRISAQYPGTASAQLMAVGTGSGGLYVAAYDSHGYTKSFNTANTGDGIELSACYVPPDGPYQRCEQEYDVVAGPWQGTWYDAADIYKAWAVKQDWCSRKLHDRRDIPDWIKKAPLFITVNFLKPEKDKPPVSQYDNVLPNVKGYADRLHRPVCALFGDWHGRGYYIAPHYFPPCGGDKKFMEVTDGLRKSGNYSLVFLCSVFWTVEKKPPAIYQPYDDWERFRREGEPYSIVGPDGKTAFSGVPDKKIGQNAILCPATDYTQRLMKDICRNCEKLHISMVQIETVGGGVPICYSPNHGHPAGGGRYITQSLYHMFRSILRHGRRRDPDFVLTTEEPGEFYIPALSGYHCRDNNEMSWPRSGPGVRGVPLYTYLYHEYSLGYGGHGARITDKTRDRASEYCHAAGFVYGKAPAIHEWSAHIEAKDQQADQVRIMKGIAAILDGPACKYLMMGRMLHPLSLNLPETQIPFWNEQKKAGEKLSFPSILHSAWEYPPRDPGQEAPPRRPKPFGHGYAFINISEAPVEFTPLLPPPLPGRMYSARQYGEWIGPRDLARDASEPINLPLKLQPGESTFIELVCGAE